MTPEELMEEVKKLDRDGIMELAVLIFAWLSEMSADMGSEEKKSILTTAVHMAEENFA